MKFYRYGDACHSRGACAGLDPVAGIQKVQLPGAKTKENPVLFQSLTFLDAGSVIPDSIRDRHDKQELSTFLGVSHRWV